MAIMALISDLDPDIGPSAVRDHFRLGKFNDAHSRPRPILVKLNRTSEVESILSKRARVTGLHGVKPDLPQEVRQREYTLMKERWALTQSGVERSDIKIRGSSILLRKKLHAQYINGVLVHEQIVIPTPVSPTEHDSSFLDDDTTPTNLSLAPSTLSPVDSILDSVAHSAAQSSSLDGVSAQSPLQTLESST